MNNHETNILLNSLNKKVAILGDDQKYIAAISLLIDSCGKYYSSTMPPASDAVDFIKEVDPGLLLMVYTSDLTEYFALRKALKREELTPKFVLVIERQQLSQLMGVLEGGIDAVLIKGEEVARLLDILSHVLKNNVYLSSVVLNHLVDNLQLTEGFDLTAREFEVLVLLGKGFRYASIASELNVGIETVRTHAKNIYSKMGVHSKENALKMAREMRII